ncbi:TonB-dependent receptor [Sphingomonas endolithica]|uniref:TonB-dependent receptor n=1 Tax=Sphingomonas endolithica TaxID=2972485 RepID=UPI0021AF9F50|nr:TonB-dependent receptor [Sphingomonas sp. ZFBP2030]
MRLKTFILSSTSLLVMTGAVPALAQTSTDAAPATASPSVATDVQTDQGTPASSVPDAPAGDDIVVQGIRRSLQSAQAVKRDSIQQIDSVVASDIGKLPDIAVSDTAARIAGVQVNRVGGEASGVLVRGLPDFTTTYNGREIFTAEARTVALQDFPASGIQALEVYKSTTSNLVEAGLAGLINVRSRRPFDFDGFEIAGSAWGVHTTEAGKVTPNGNILISNRWDTGIGEIGILANASYTELSYLDSEPTNTDFIASPTINGQSVRLPDIQRLFYRSGNRKRPSGNVALQWRPSSSLEFYAEGLYQGFRNEVSDRQLEVPLYGDANTTYSNIVLRPGTNQVQSGTVTNSNGALLSFQGATYNKTDTYQFAVGGIYNSGPLKITVDLARTKSTFTGSTESIDRTLVGGQTVNFDLETPQFSIPTLNVGNPANYLFDGLYEEAQQAKGGDYQARLDAEYKTDGGLLRSLQVGIRYTDRKAHREFGSRYASFRGKGIPQSALPLDIASVPSGLSGTGIQQDLTTFLAPTYDSVRSNLTALRQFVIDQGGANYTLDTVAADPNSTYDATEKTYAAYAQINYAFGDIADGVIGLRAVRTEVGIDGTQLALPVGNGPAVQTPVTAEQKFTDYLPNASVRFHLTDRLQLRLSATQTRTRPTFSQLNPSSNLGQPGTQDNPTDPFANARNGRGGNPNLQPLKSNNYDASLEYYFARAGFLSGAVFRRDLDGFIQDQSIRFTDPVLGPIILTQPVNSTNGRIDGAEAQLSTFFDFAFVPTFLREFGVQLNYTYLDAKTGFPDGDGGFTQDRILGVSKHTYNVAGFYEHGPLSLRLSYNKRSKTLESRQVRGTPTTPGDIDLYTEEGHPAGRLDLSTSVNFTKNATIFFDATNLLADPYRVELSSARGGAERAEYNRFLRFEERTFTAGLRFRF